MTEKSYNGKAIYNPKGKAGEYSVWACNFFTGCSHNCSYCYCKRGVMSHIWGDEPKLKKCFKDADHALSIFEKELMAHLDSVRKTGIFFSFTTDPMIPNKTLELTLRAAEMALKNDVPIQILTKRADWWDSDIWTEMIYSTFLSKKDKVAIGFTLTGHDELEPGASSNADRIRIMCSCQASGFHTFASIEPIVDIASSENVMEESSYFCEFFKVGLMSNGLKPDKGELKEMVNKWNHRLAMLGVKVYWKQSVTDYLGDDFVSHPTSCVKADYNIFDS